MGHGEFVVSPNAKRQKHRQDDDIYSARRRLYWFPTSMRTLALIAALLVVLPGSGETLREFLKNNAIPANSFSKAELDQEINGAAGGQGPVVIAVYVRIQGDAVAGDPRLVRFDKISGAVERAEVKPENEDLCCGSPLQVDLMGDFTLLYFHINPSADCVLVLGKDRKLITTLYGFDVREVAPGQVVFVEDMMHFAPLHPERLELADLRTGKKLELYPPEGDALRAAFAREHAQHMPPKATCEKMDDPCTPEDYDESIDFVDADGHGSFAFVVHRDALHATASEQPPDSVASGAALYHYAGDGKVWLYCEESLSDEEAKALTPLPGRQAGGSAMKARCTPNLPVAPDMSNAEYSPFEDRKPH